ncbi:MAG: pyruvate, water dikinase [Deltaproteobacteria bacterium]|nr:pyruvate, water dikinase [Deltaproteobacteria bacterium]
MRQFFKQIFSLFQPEPKADYVQLQNIFQRHYRSFRSLLTANNNALELMAEMEETLGAGKPFGMAFVRGNCTALSANIYKMIKHLVELADGKYATLHPVFQEITGQLENVLRKRKDDSGGKHILTMEEIDRNAIDQAGEKMANLGEIRNRTGLATPDGFVITASAARYFMEQSKLDDEINRILQSLNENNLEELYTASATIQKLLSSSPLPEDLEKEMTDAYQQMAGGTDSNPLLVSMRSSALGEDGTRVSFAGQYRTQLNVYPEFLGQTYKEILAGKYKSQAIVYREQRGYRHQDVVMCVGCLAMVDAVCSGVSYSRLPDNPHSAQLVIYAVRGLGSHAVDGSAPYDCYQVSRQPAHDIVLRQSAAEGAAMDETGGREPFMLTDPQIVELARSTVLLENHFGLPQDIEWSIDKSGKLFILQSRPLGETEPVQQTEPAGDQSGPAIMTGGVTASRGVACGPVYWVNSSLDVLQFPQDAVLAVKVPYPDWAVLVNRAAAIISETGQAATHLATVAREFGVPALFNTGAASAELANGALVTVDATRRRVYQGRIESILAGEARKPDLMKDSPVYEILKEALAHIAPLNLTDPASPFFRASACKTLHDITRFCHEKAVKEMFELGGRYHFDNRCAKQLVVEAPFQWWIINLEDGFKEGVDPGSRYISLNDIQSEPMLAIWQGMTAIPWEGPPPVDLKGFGAIIFQSTMNPRLDPAVRSGMAGKNYFLVSRKFCNLSVRLGYHFALAEANLSEFLTESYISFQFKGGAADERRRLLRVSLLSEILRKYDFRVEQKGDAVTARIEKMPVEFLAERLKVLGFLLIHTRQIDMVMGDESRLDQYREKLYANLAGIVPGIG